MKRTKEPSCIGWENWVSVIELRFWKLWEVRCPREGVRSVISIFEQLSFPSKRGALPQILRFASLLRIQFKFSPGTCICTTVYSRIPVQLRLRFRNELWFPIQIAQFQIQFRNWGSEWIFRLWQDSSALRPENMPPELDWERWPSRRRCHHCVTFLIGLIWVWVWSLCQGSHLNSDLDRIGVWQWGWDSDQDCSLELRVWESLEYLHDSWAEPPLCPTLHSDLSAHVQFCSKIQMQTAVAEIKKSVSQKSVQNLELSQCAVPWSRSTFEFKFKFSL